MVMRDASDTGADTSSDPAHSRAITARLRYSDWNMVAADDPDIGGGYLAPSPACEALRDRQILEQLLSAAQIADPSRRADELVQRYGSLSAVLAGNREADRDDPVSFLLAAVYQTLLEAIRPKPCDRICLSSARNVIEYLFLGMANLPVEEVRVLFLNSRNKLIKDEAVARGSISEAPIYSREILRRALELGSTAVILAHNHPSGDPEPSDSDIHCTKRLMMAGHELGISVHDHIIVGSAGWVSMKNCHHI
jgi:DNA repair protein RadC